MNVDFQNVVTTVKSTVLSKKGIAIGVAIGCVIFAYNMLTSRVIPMTYNADAIGPYSSDLAATGVSILTALVSFIASSYLGVSPEIIQAVVAFEKDKTNQDNVRRLGSAVMGYLVGVMNKHPDTAGGFTMSLLGTLITNLEDGEVKESLKSAAVTIATNEFKPKNSKTVPVVEVKPATPPVVGPTN